MVERFKDDTNAQPRRAKPQSRKASRSCNPLKEGIDIGTQRIGAYRNVVACLENLRRRLFRLVRRTANALHIGGHVPGPVGGKLRVPADFRGCSALFSTAAAIAVVVSLTSSMTLAISSIATTASPVEF